MLPRKIKGGRARYGNLPNGSRLRNLPTAASTVRLLLERFAEPEAGTAGAISEVNATAHGLHHLEGAEVMVLKTAPERTQKDLSALTWTPVAKATAKEWDYLFLFPARI
jgi:hypothetical protein